MTSSEQSWKILSNHGMVLFYIAAHPKTTQRAIAAALGITERQVANIVKDLAHANLIEIMREGRSNRYIVNQDEHFRHPLMAHIPLRDVFEVVLPKVAPEATGEKSTSED
ncbi:MAG: MarR family transcriptional regulator [Chloroflexota bacterium]|nr:MarR family transcriptional regulator [Chloroflexota bacterium]